MNSACNYCIFNLISRSVLLVSIWIMVKSVENGASLPPFLVKCYEMVDDESTNELISWTESNDSFMIWNESKFSSQLLPKYFKHNNFSSFVRQLNIYVRFSLFWVFFGIQIDCEYAVSLIFGSGPYLSSGLMFMFVVCAFHLDCYEFRVALTPSWRNSNSRTHTQIESIVNLATISWCHNVFRLMIRFGLWSGLIIV